MRGSIGNALNYGRTKPGGNNQQYIGVKCYCIALLLGVIARCYCIPLSHFLRYGVPMGTQ